MREFHACKQEEWQSLHEKTLPPKEVAPALHAIRAGRIQKNQKKKSHKVAKGNQGKGKAKMGYTPVQAPLFAPKPKNPPTPKKNNSAKDVICHQCGEVELYSFPSTSWVYDTGCGTYICITTQGLRRSKKPKPGALSLYVGDGHHAAVEAIGEFHLCLPSGLDDIYEIILSSSNTNDSSMYAVSNKRAKLNLDSVLLWHCRIGHISKKRIEKLQVDGLLDSTDVKSFEKCVSCMSGKMARKPYSHHVERPTDLLGLIHIDVCGPFKIMSRQ
uniref:GAG-pre-integrase domain-containing protein n=1 Tax=Tanacetum cinerariifolium TaxID=118510 RepID=A0A6L2LIY4_TANCI|nr:hypothetical protein [Tanacetum cinerariifolium]